MEGSVTIIMINEINNQYTVMRSSFIGKSSLKQGIKKFSQKVYKATYDEIIQLHQIRCFKPIKLVGLNLRERKRAV